MSRLFRGMMGLSTPPQPEPAAAEETAAPTPPRERSYEELKQRIHALFVERVDLSQVVDLSSESIRREARTLIETLCDRENPLLGQLERERLIGDVLDESFGYGPLEPLLKDPTISQIFVNAPDRVFVERQNRLEKMDTSFRDTEHVLAVASRMASRDRRRLEGTSALVETRLPDGSQVEIVLPPLSRESPVLTIRRAQPGLPLDWEDLLHQQSFTNEMGAVMEAAIRGRLNVVISGSLDTGKTTLLNLLARFLPAEDRILVVDEGSGVRLPQEHVVRLEPQLLGGEGRTRVTARELLAKAVRMLPDWLILGDCRGPEAVELLQAMESGCACLTNICAPSPEVALSRLETMALLGWPELPVSRVRQMIASAVQIIIQIKRLRGGLRRVVSITEVTGVQKEHVATQEIFRFVQQGIDATGRAMGHFEITGMVPTFLPRLEMEGIRLPVHMFTRRVL